MLPKRSESIIEKQGDYIEGLLTDNRNEIKVLVRNIVCITFEMASISFYIITCTQVVR